MTTDLRDAQLPALDEHRRRETGNELQSTLVELIDLSLIGKQLHWNIFGRPFKPLHEHIGTHRHVRNSSPTARP